MPTPPAPSPTVHAYERHPYRTVQEVTVLAAEEDERGPYVVLDDTILYPEGGGQPADRGRLNETEVIDVQRVDGAIRHYVGGGGAHPGTARLTLDWKRRYDHMQQHTAQHLISAIAADACGWETTSFHLGVDRCDVELDVARLEARAMVSIEDRVAEAIRQALPVTARRIPAGELAGSGARSRGLRDDHTGDVRLVEIEGIDTNTCGGTHVASTAEIEVVKLLGTEPMRGGTRLYWVAGTRVRRRLDAMLERTGELRRLFETSEDDLLEVAKAKLERLQQLGKKTRDLERRLAFEAAGALLAHPDEVVEGHFDDADGRFLGDVARRLAAELGDRRALLTASDTDDNAAFAVVAGDLAADRLREDAERIASLLDGRGGGGGQVYQGRAGSLTRRHEALSILRGGATGDR